jgi:hypothetical protein
VSETKTIPEGVADAYVITTYQGRALPVTYRNMIYSKWLRSLRHGNDMLKMVPSEAYFAYHHLLIDTLLDRVDTHVRIAALADDLDVVLGFAVLRPELRVIDYVYVNRDMRKQGIGTALCPVPGGNADAFFSHVTKTGLAIVGKKCPKLRYHPYV